MNDDYRDAIAYHIRLIWDNDEGSHLYIQELINDADEWTELADALADFYEESIDFVLRETPSSSIGHMLVAEICMYVVGRDIFDAIARVYWEDKQSWTKRVTVVDRTFRTSVGVSVTIPVLAIEES